MTTAASTVPYSDVPTQEDVMELSTDFDRHPGTDGDTDIDIDLVPDQPQDQDNDYMIEDTRSEGGTGSQTFPNETGNDDVMLDEEGSQGDINEVNILQDEDLGDAGDYLQDGANQNSLALPEHIDEYHDNTLQRIDQVIPQTDTVFSALPGNFEDKAREYPEDEISDNKEEDVLGVLDTQENAEALKQRFQASNISEPTGSVLEDTRDVLDWSEIPSSIGDAETDQKTTNEEGGPQAGNSTSKLGSPNLSPDKPQHERAYEAPSVHPVVVLYQGAEISLFPPSDQSNSTTFFLHDESLASSSINDLLLACKEVLADSISEEDELVLTIEELGLCISEDSKSAADATLSQILNTYVQLLHQDGTSDIGPLYMNLETRTSFSKRLRGLIDAAKDGKGISQLTYWDVPSDDDTATAADGDITHSNGQDQIEETEAPDEATDKLGSDPVDNTSTPGQFVVSKTDVTVSQDGSVPLELSHDHDKSQVPDVERSGVTSDLYEAPTSDGLLETTTTGNTDSGLNEHDRYPPPEQAQRTPHSQDGVTSAHLVRADEEEDGDLIDYEEGENRPLQDSTGSSTLAGDEAAGVANGMSVPACDPCTQPSICYCALCNNQFTTENDPNSQHDHETISLTSRPTGNISNNAHVETEESLSPTKEAIQANDHINHDTNQIQEEYGENGDDEEYDLGTDEETFGSGIVDATANPSEQHLQYPQAQDSEESVALVISADDGDYGNETTGVPHSYDTQDFRVNGTEQQQPPDLTVVIDESHPETDAEGITSTRLEYIIADNGQTTDALETSQADLEASRHDLSSNNGVGQGKWEDASPHAVASVSAADDDEINYDEDETVYPPSQKTQDGHLNSENPSPSNPASIKRPRGEYTEHDVLDEGSQDIKRVRSS